MAVISSIQIDTKSAQKSIAELEKELQETNEQLRNVDVNSEAFTDLQKKAAAAKGQLDKINQTTDALSKGFQGFGENLAKVTGGISGGITAATAAMQLMGIENENVMAGIAKLQQLMAFTQGISSLKDLGSGFSSLIPVMKSVVGGLNGVKGALIGTGIGAIAVAVGVLISRWDELTEKLNEFVGVSKDVNVVTAAMEGFLAGLKQTVIAVGNAIVQYVKTPFETVINAVKAFSEESGSIYDKIKAAGNAAAKTIKDNAQDVVDEFAEVGTKASTAYNDSVAEQDQKAQDERTAAAVKAAEDRAKKVAEAEKAAREKAQKEYSAEEEALQIEEEKNKRLELSEEEAYNRQMEIEQRRLENIKKLYGEESLEYERQLTTMYNLKKQYDEKMQGDSSSETSEEAQPEDPVLKQLQDRAKAYEESLVTEEEMLKRRMELIEQYHQQGLLSEQEYQSLLAQVQQESEENQMATLTALQQQKLEVFSQFSKTFQDACSAITDNLDENNEEQFKAIKAFQIASATMQTIEGAIGAYMGASSNPGLNAIPVVGPALAIAMGVTNAAIVTASGIANIRKIASQQFNSNSSSAASASMSAGATASTITPPTQYSQAVEGVNIEEGVTDSKVYVVESDIQAVGNKVNVQETENRY